MKVSRYQPGDATAWDAFVAASKNGTFLHKRGYMDYHAERFHDHSLVVTDDKNDLIALLPANRKDGDLVSHGGLTYGGLITGTGMTTPRLLDVFSTLLDYARQDGIKRFYYKTIPAIYHRCPADEDLYALFRNNAQLIRRDVLSVVDYRQRLTYQERRRRKIKQARTAGLQIEETQNFTSFWPVLEQALAAKHDTKPVHNLEEINLLTSRFPQHIRLHTAQAGGEIVAGVVMYDTGLTGHAQYIAASEKGREIGALDLLFAELIDVVYAGRRFFDFGISTEDGGRSLNAGLVEQKEGFGARTLTHDHYELSLA